MSISTVVVTFSVREASEVTISRSGLVRGQYHYVAFAIEYLLGKAIAATGGALKETDALELAVLPEVLKEYEAG